MMMVAGLQRRGRGVPVGRLGLELARVRVAAPCPLALSLSAVNYPACSHPSREKGAALLACLPAMTGNLSLTREDS